MLAHQSHRNRLELVADNLSFPTSLTFDNLGRAYIAEAGLPFGGAPLGGRVWRLELDGSRSLLAEKLHVPVNGLIFHEGSERVHVYDLPAFQNALSLVHQGSFRSLDQTYRILIDWIARENYRVCGPYREVFLRHEPGGNESRFLTEVQVPIEKISEQG